MEGDGRRRWREIVGGGESRERIVVREMVGGGGGRW